MTARPLAVWNRTNRRRDLARLRELCRLQGVGRVVVGWPLHLNGTAGEMAAEAAAFAERVRKNLGLPVELADERLSSWEAGQLLADPAAGGRASRRRKKATDDVAAAVILRDYLSRDRGSG
jgi:putative Holliday junction resolvase